MTPSSPARRAIAAAAAAALTPVPLLSARANAEPAPSPLRLIVPYGPGGSSDRTARILAEGLQTRLARPVVVENLTGAGGRLAMKQIATMPADTPVIVVANPALMTVAPLVYRNNGYDPDRDFQPLAQVSTYEFAASVAGAVPVREFNHLLAWMRANPEKATIGVPATGSLPHFFALMLGQAAGIRTEVVGYRGSASLITDLVGGHLPMAVDSLDTVIAQHEAGKLRILATSGAKRSVPTIPTFREAGLPVTAIGWNVVFAKATMPAELAERIARELRALMGQADVREKFQAAGAEPVFASQPETREMLKRFRAQWAPVIEKSGLKFD